MMVVVVAAVAFALVVMVPQADATRYIVGANMGWTTNVNYTIWAQSKHFYNGDWLCKFFSLVWILSSSDLLGVPFSSTIFIALLVVGTSFSSKFLLVFWRIWLLNE